MQCLKYQYRSYNRGRLIPLQFIFPSQFQHYNFICVFTSYRSLQAYIVSIKSDEHTEQAKFQESDCSKEKLKERYKIEAKNSELKHRHVYDVASSSGLVGMEMQGAMAIFTVNLKRILKLSG